MTILTKQPGPVNGAENRPQEISFLRNHPFSKVEYYIFVQVCLIKRAGIFTLVFHEENITNTI